MKKVLITSKAFGSQLDMDHRKQLIKYFQENGWQLIWNSADRAMSASDIINADAEHALDAIVVYSSSDEINGEVFACCRNLKVVSRHGLSLIHI